MFPSNFIETAITENETEETGIDFLFDYETGQHIMKGAVLKECDKLQTVRQYIQDVLRTKAKIYKVYSKDENDVFGISVYNYLGTRTLPDGYLNSELKREVTQLLLKHPLISEVKDWVGTRERRGLAISFTVVLTDGNLITISETVSSQAVI